MAVISELLLMTGILSAFYTSEFPEVTDVATADKLDSIVDNYETPKSLYDLISNFPVDEEIKCPESDTRLPYPGDCSRFITCKDFKAHIRACPPGFKFDKVSLNCKFGFQVTCNNSAEIDHLCGANEIYSDCGPVCEVSCDQPEDLTDCYGACVKGCFCKEGFVRSPLRICIPAGKCNTNNMLEPWFLINAFNNKQTAQQESSIEGKSSEEIF